MVKRLLGWLRGPGGPAGCLACGVCCEYYAGTLEASAEDLARWRTQGREDLLARVGAEGEIWVEPATGVRLEACPFLERSGPERAVCGIHATKPRVCAAYPTPYHGLRCIRRVQFPARRFEPSAL